MPSSTNPELLESSLAEFVERQQEQLIQIVQDLVRIPSENTPPDGAEAACQGYVANFLKELGLKPDIYSPPEVPGICKHPLYYPGRNYTDRQNVAARLPGRAAGRSLILSGHADTVPRGTQAWTRAPFGGSREGNCLFGRGSNDMKAGIATNLFIFWALAEMGIRLAGDLIFEAVVDEEFGGSNGTLAGRLRGYIAEAAVISEPSFLRVCPGQRGGRTAHIVLEAAAGGVLNAGGFPTRIIDQLTFFMAKVKEFAGQRRRRAKVHELYKSNPDPVPVSITKVVTSPWGPREPITIPEQCQIEMYWQTMPGETQSEVEQEFFTWLDSVVVESEGLFDKRPAAIFPMRWLPGSAISIDEPLVTELASCSRSVLRSDAIVAGIEGPCDLYIFQQGFGIPAVLWGARGGNTHGADEYVEIDSVVSAAKALLLFVCRWCGVSKA